jgi:hypothetical protein
MCSLPHHQMFNRRDQDISSSVWGISLGAQMLTYEGELAGKHRLNRKRLSWRTATLHFQLQITRGT